MKYKKKPVVIDAVQWTGKNHREMTPKEKARELFDKYQIAGSQWYVDTTKKYALITVDEILLLCPFETYRETLSPYDGAELSTKYWQEVRQEIENL